MTPTETAVLEYLLKKGLASDSQIENQFGITSGALVTIMRSLKTKLLVEQDGRCYRPNKAAEGALQPLPTRQPFARQVAW